MKRRGSAWRRKQRGTTLTMTQCRERGSSRLDSRAVQKRVGDTQKT